MPDYFETPPGFSDPPPEPATPPPDFLTAGVSFATGIGQTSLLKGIWDGFLEAAASFLTWALGWLLRIAIKVIAYFVNLLGDIQQEGSVEYGQLVAASLKELFGITVNPASVNTRRSGADRQGVANTLGQTIIGTLFSGVKANPTGGVVPSDAAANNYLAVMMNMSLNGWIESFYADAVSYHLLEKLGDLKDVIARVLGLGRMSRQVFAPPLKVLVHDPYLALLEGKYRTKPIAEGTALQAFLRAQIDRDALGAILAPQGYKEQDIDWLILQHTKYLSDADVDYLLSRKMWTRDQANSYMQLQGWNPASADHILDILEDKRLQKYRIEASSVAEAAYVRGDIDIGQFQSLVDGTGLTDVENSWIVSIAKLKRQTHITRLTLGQIEQGIKDGIMNLNDLSAWAARNNMPADDLAFLELMTLFSVNRQTVTAAAKAAAAKAKADAAKAKVDAAAAKAAAAKAEAADKGLTVAEAETLVQDGYWTFTQLTSYLAAKGYGIDAITAIESLLHHKIDTLASKQPAAGSTRAAAAAKGLNLGEIEKAVVDGILTLDDLKNWLTGQGFSTADSQVIVDLTEHAVQDAQLKAAAKAAAAEKAGKKNISLPDLERAVRLKVTPISTYTDALTKAGFDQHSIDLLTGILAAQTAPSAPATVPGSPTTPGTKARVPTPSQIEQEVTAGIRPIADYTAELGRLGYSPADQTQLTALLADKIAHAKHAVALHSDALGKATARGIGLAAAEAAVLGGINTFDDYDAMLTTLGYDQADRDTLEALLFAKVAAKAAKGGGSVPEPTPPAP